MQQISFSYDIQHSINAPLPAVFAFLADVHNIIACSSDVERYEVIDSRTAKWMLKTQEQFGLTFTPEYTLSYDFIPNNSIAWRTLDGNVALAAQVILSTLDDGRTSVTVKEEVRFPLDLSSTMAKVVSTFARITTRNETVQWLKRAADRLEQAAPELTGSH